MLLALSACAAAPGTAPLNDSIMEESLRADVVTIAHDSTQGRLVGTPEIEKVADWIRERFQAAGLEPAGDAGGYDQRFDMVWFSLGDGSTIRVSDDGRERQVGDGWYPLNVSASTTASGPVVFAGFGIVEPRLQYDDYRGADLTGRFVLIMEREPGVDDPASPFDGIVTADASREHRKVMAAQEAGAAGVLFVRDVHNRDDIEDWSRAASFYWPAEKRRIERFLLSDWVEPITIPVAAISTEIAEALFGNSGTTLLDAARKAEQADNGLGVIELPGAHVELNVSVERHITPGRNIAGMVRGADEARRNEAVIVMAHHDMNGVEDGVVYGGADDNASGTAGLIAIAEAFARAAEEGIRPERSVIFVASDAEERGPSLGAWHYTLHPTLPLENTVGVFNLDMIGRNEEVPAGGGGRFRGLAPQTAESNANAFNVLGYSRTPQLAQVVQDANGETQLTIRLRYDNNESNLLRRSDQWPFLQNGVPALFIHTGLHPDYHTGDDVADRLNYEKMTRITRLIHQATWNLANSNERPVVEPMGARPRS